MNGKKAKQVRKVDEAKQKESMVRREAFIKEVKSASAKYRYDMVAGLQYGDTALMPVIVMVDVKDKYEHMTEEAKKQVQNQVVKKESAVPKLEV